MASIGVASAEIKSIKCTYLLEKWKQDDLANYSQCPSGVKGLGKPWRTIVYTFNTSSDESKEASVTVREKVCFLAEHLISGKLLFTPSTLHFKYTDSIGTGRTILVNRETLINSDGQSCAIVDFDTSKNKI